MALTNFTLGEEATQAKFQAMLEDAPLSFVVRYDPRHKVILTGTASNTVYVTEEYILNSVPGSFLRVSLKWETPIFGTARAYRLDFIAKRVTGDQEVMYTYDGISATGTDRTLDLVFDLRSLSMGDASAEDLTLILQWRMVSAGQAIGDSTLKGIICSSGMSDWYGDYLGS